MTFDVYETDSVTGERKRLMGSLTADTLSDARKAARARWGIVPARTPEGRPSRGPSLEVVSVKEASSDLLVPASEVLAAKVAKEQAEADAAKAAAAAAQTEAALLKAKAEKEAAELALAKALEESNRLREQMLKQATPAPAGGGS